jgi:hypothetical protein
MEPAEVGSIFSFYVIPFHVVNADVCIYNILNFNIKTDHFLASKTGNDMKGYSTVTARLHGGKTHRPFKERNKGKCAAAEHLCRHSLTETKSGWKRSDRSTDRTRKSVKMETTVKSNLNYYN